jgi:hypothetical protein
MHHNSSLLLATILVVLTCGIGPATPSAASSASEADQDCANVVKRMPSNRFWGMIDATIGNDETVQIKAMQTAFASLSPDELIGFYLTYHVQRERAYSWEVWGAAYVANGGASDDGFEYFRDWLVSRGQKTFEAVLVDPDSLADFVPVSRTTALEFEEFASIATDLWVAKTGKDYDALSDVRGRDIVCRPGNSGSLTGKPFEDDDAALAKRYPRLWKRFGRKPLA